MYLWYKFVVASLFGLSVNIIITIADVYIKIYTTGKILITVLVILVIAGGRVMLLETGVVYFNS